MSRRMIRTQPHSGGWLEVVCGPMFSGKSEELIRRLRRAEIAGQRALIVKPLIDDRYDVGHVVSHAGANDETTYRVHDKLGRPCERCGTPIARVDFEEHTIYYCPTCQTGGRVLKDRRLSRLLK